MTSMVVVNRAMSLDGFVAAPGSSTTSGAVAAMRFRVVTKCAG